MLPGENYHRNVRSMHRTSAAIDTPAAATAGGLTALSHHAKLGGKVTAGLGVATAGLGALAAHDIRGARKETRAIKALHANQQSRVSARTSGAFRTG